MVSPVATDHITFTGQQSLSPLIQAIERRISITPSLFTLAIDGRSGAGKTTLARSLTETFAPEHPTTLFSLENMYQGWEGLLPATEEWADMLPALREHGCSNWTGWDWTHSQPLPHQVLALAQQPGQASLLIAEGVGSFCAAADFRIWVERPTDLRKKAAFDRDGDTYRPFWNTWASQENRLFRQRAERYRHCEVLVYVPSNHPC